MRKLTTSDRIKQIMSERNLKQVDILEMSKPFQKEFNIKLGKSALSQYVNGVQAPDDKKIFLLSKTLNVSEPWLMGYEVERERKEITEPTTQEETIDLKDVLNRTVAFDGHTLDDNDAELIKSLLENMVKNKD
ncbi:helix-turn-helix domain-containing protein [Streptococcus parauberis]|uniref:helix-turn-helix domain-containing protein n=2 Tax=Streptococcus parauberis TaxID=1348 RepID=UPI000789AE37|nr:helix-turn-helix domain-containing protein [Streptococcus parauberis]QBX18193.1 repressor [Streptococcus phage Javan399]KYP20824.1 helix-turn-helix protein [Streptococcus parauberis]KYP21208.1 helix-turn-helix protein [Streptococcus parauberis]KYP22396.1 helix-turn-helix protein [Streptococcus parauberis]KYP24867.1 helix-turn-helix protein [Streptococcus parauberis]